jgi:hypothetical protein
MNLPVIVKKYLDKYGLNKWGLNKPAENIFNIAVIVPVIAELENIKTLISSLIKNDNKYFGDSIFIFVINNSNSSSAEVKEENKNTLLFLDEQSELQNSGLNIFYIDASTDGNELPAKEAGVGLARKIGMDAALKIFDYNSARKKILICLDADCTVSTNYLTGIADSFNERNLHAASIYFEHDISGSSVETAAIICYEIFLRYYVEGLKFAGSPYAFHTIGSSMACSHEAYIKIEGMNKRKAAEDFYFLEKLAKIFPVAGINNAAVYPSPRGSWRVPFGTGQRVTRFLNKTQDEYLLYKFKSFMLLKEWIQLYHSTNNLIEIMNGAGIEIKAYLEEIRFEESFRGVVENSKSRQQLELQKKRLFDGFKTLKLIHYLRDNYFPQQNMFDALDELFSSHLSTGKKIPPIEVQKEYLKKLRQAQRG